MPQSDHATIHRKVPAKINLWLEVIRKRQDGYHDISSLMLPVSVFDRISIDIRPGEDGPVSITCDSPDIPCNSENLAWRAADLYLKTSGKKAAVSIDLEKRIPWGAGLGGGSSDAAGVLSCLNVFFDSAVPIAELAKLAVSLGADVPFFLHSRPALATGIGEKLQFIENVPDYPLVLIKPDVAVPTRWVYQNLNLTKGAPQIKLDGLGEFLQVGDLTQNDLESVTVAKYPIIAELKEWLIGQGALAASMSGSGPTVFGIFGTAEAARNAEVIAKNDWPDCWVHSAHTAVNS